MKSNQKAARSFGLFFILTFLSYGIGNGLVESIVSDGSGLSGIHTHKNQIVLGVILMSLVHTFANIGLATIMLPILKPFNHTVAYGYYGAAIAATITLMVGGIFLLLQIPLSNEYVAGGADITQIQMLSALFVKANFYAYQIGMAIWGIGGLMFCRLLCWSKLVPKAFPIWGFLGYLIFITGTIFELFGYEYGLMMNIPGGLFEIVLSVWLIIKGFKSSVSYTSSHLSTS